jgi:hypothetical protein
MTWLKWQAIRDAPIRISYRNPTCQELGRDQNTAFVIETGSPFRPSLEARYLQATGAAPLISEYGKLSVIEKRSR